MLKQNYREMMRDWEWRQYHSRFGMAGEGQADLIEKYLKRHPGLVLYVGCGNRSDAITNLATLCTALVVTDKYSEMLLAATPNPKPSNVSFLLSDAHDLRVPSETVDHILALGLFAHIEQTIFVFREFYRVCRPGGYLMLTNSVQRTQNKYEEAGNQVGFKLIEHSEGYCPDASGTVKRRYILIFSKPA
jgi:ubiquinone/menaquinone biosynthesis C-methylase UbiE